MTRNTRRIARFIILLLASATAVSAQTAKQGMANPISNVKFEKDADVGCLSSAMENGNPDSGPSTVILKVPPDCPVPWHYHTAEEQLMVVQGNVLTEMEGVPPSTLGPGGFAVMQSKEKHQFSCKSKSACLLFVTFDRAYDIFWVKEAGSSKGPGE
jgi:quercetin dioxygenase-like cupin family protein